MIAPDRDALLAEITIYEAAETLVEHWGAERRRQERERAEFHAELQRIRSTSSTAPAIFHGKKQLTRKQRIQQDVREQREREERDKERKAKLRARRGSGPVRKCRECQTIYRGIGETCGCKLCAHCNKRFRTAGFKCGTCKHNPLLLTGSGTETRSFVPHREAQPRITQLSAAAERVEDLLEQIPDWMADAIHHRYRLKESDRTAAENLMIPIPTFVGRARAAVARVAELLANHETARV